MLGLVGKAITFDAGGISLKPALNMQDMKGDMAGGAAVIAAMGAIAELELPVRIDRGRRRRREPASAATPSGPGDILRAANGKTIEITNTDAEGRLVLADALWYARREGATHLLDLATLTGAMELALGDLYAGLFANDEEWRGRDRRPRRDERRPRLAVPAPPALPALRRLHVRRPEELLRRCGRARLCSRRSSCASSPAKGRGRTSTWQGPASSSARAATTTDAARRHGLRRSPDRQSSRSASPLNFDLDQEHELVRAHRARVRASSASRRSRRSSTASSASVRARRRAGRARADGHDDPARSTAAPARTRVSYAIAIEELTRIDSSVAITVAAHHSLGTLPIYYFGTEEQKQQWLPELASGKKLAAFGLTEPDAGSDAGATRTHARSCATASGSSNGSKIFITNARHRHHARA